MKEFCRCLLGTFLLPAVLYLGTAPASAQSNADSNFYGKWRVTRDLSPEGTIGARNQRQILAIIGKVAVIDAGRFTFNGSNCNRPKYMRSSDDTATYFYREWRVNSDEMPFGDRVSVIEVDCGPHFLYPVDENRLIIADDGEFFEAVRTDVETTSNVAPAQAEASNKANADIFGTWLIDGADWKGSGYDSEVMKRKKASIYMGMPVYISAKRFLYNGNQCKNPTYKRSRQERTSYFHGDWRAAKGRLLFLPKIFTVVETDCGAIYPINSKLILIEDKSGIFFTAVPLSSATK